MTSVATEPKSKEISVFAFRKPVEFLARLRLNYPGFRRPITLQRWAQRLGYKSPRSLAMVLDGTRQPTTQMILALARDLSWTAEEKRYFEILVLQTRYEKNGKAVPEALEQELKLLSPRTIKKRILEDKDFEAISSWPHWAIGQLAFSADFPDDPVTISRRMRFPLTSDNVRECLQRLERLGILERDAKTGRLQASDAASFTVGNANMPSRAIQRSHKQSLRLAEEALNVIPSEERYFTSLTVLMNRKRLEEARRFVKEFRNRFDKAFFDAEGDDVFQLSFQFFELTKP